MTQDILLFHWDKMTEYKILSVKLGLKIYEVLDKKGLTTVEKAGILEAVKQGLFYTDFVKEKLI